MVDNFSNGYFLSCFCWNNDSTLCTVTTADDNKIKGASMEVGSWIWKLSYIIHVVSNAISIGLFFVFSFATEEMLKEDIAKRYLKIAGIFISGTGLTGILLLSILTMTGMDDLTSNPIGQSVLVMITGYILVLFVYSLALIYKGGEARLYKKFFAIMFYTYLIVYVIRVYLTN